MQIHISTADGVPIYLQIVNQVKYLVSSGRLAAGEELPPIRTLAEKLVDQSEHGRPRLSRAGSGRHRRKTPHRRHVRLRSRLAAGPPRAAENPDRTNRRVAGRSTPNGYRVRRCRQARRTATRDHAVHVHRGLTSCHKTSLSAIAAGRSISAGLRANSAPRRRSTTSRSRSRAAACSASSAATAPAKRRSSSTSWECSEPNPARSACSASTQCKTRSARSAASATSPKTATCPTG